MMPPFARIKDLIGRQKAAALVTVIRARGSTPREAGARMIVSKDGAIAGTIGGGRLEQEAIDMAVGRMEPGRDDYVIARFALGPALGQCCGGHVTIGVDIFTEARLAEVSELAAAEAAGVFTCRSVIRSGEPLRRSIMKSGSDGTAAELGDDMTLTETFGRRARCLYLFGAGHVGRALVLALAPLPLDVVWIDERADMFPPAVPSNVRLVSTRQPEETIAGAEAGSFIIVMTHDHDIDLRIMHAALERGGFGYVGLIGSATKRARFESRLASLGIEPAAARDFRCPIGVSGIRSKEPAHIAAAVAAELLITDEALSSAIEKPAIRDAAVA